MDKDCAEGKVYWSDISAKSIFSSKYDGTEKETFINSDTVSPEGVAIDWVSRRLYWTDSGKDTIEVASLDNSTLRSVLINKGLVNPRGIALDPHSKYVIEHLKFNLINIANKSFQENLLERLES